VPIALFLEAATLNKTVSLDLTLGKEGLAKYKKEPSTWWLALRPLIQNKADSYAM
jgi:hypothetical protein